MSQALKDLREIGAVAELRRQAERARPAVMTNNAHLHLPPNFSSFRTVAQTLEAADAQGCRIVGASNYYDCTIYNEFAAAARRRNVFPLYGLEIVCMSQDLRDGGIRVNDPVNPGKMYICGKGIVKFAQLSEEAQRISGVIKSGDAARMRSMAQRLSQLFARHGVTVAIDAGRMIEQVAKRHGVAPGTVFLQERHVAQCLQEQIFAEVPAGERMTLLTAVLGTAPRMKSPEDAVGLQGELRGHLMKVGKPGYVEEAFIDFASAMNLIAELGGFASYPILADGSGGICPFEDPVETLTRNLKERRIHAAELIPGRNRQATVVAYTRAVRAAGLIVTAGTEHNTPEMIPLTPVCLKGEPVPAELQAIFYEGACVIAAHQFLTAHGETGYVDEKGNLNPQYRDAEARIESLAKLGDAVIRRYLRIA